MPNPAIKREESPETSIKSIPPISATRSSSKAPSRSVNIKHEEGVTQANLTPRSIIVQPCFAPTAYHDSSYQQYPVLHHTYALQNGFDAPTMMHHNNNSTNAQHAVGARQHQEHPQNKVINEMVQFSSNLSNMVQDMNERLTKVEYENQELRYMIAQQNPITPQHQSTIALHADAMDVPRSAPVGRNLSWYHYDANGSPTPARSQVTKLRPLSSSARKDRSQKTKARKQLHIKIPGKAVFAPPLTVGLPTPLTRTQSALNTGIPGSALNTAFSVPAPKTPTTSVLAPPLTTPLTPGRMGPSTIIKRAMTCINKRKIHNLNEMMPPVYAIIPFVPLTDTEVIVYFFSSLARPIVSLRLYARNWGPAHIVDVLNAHRDIDGGYLRNTCSVKCTTAIKKGKDKFGERWDEQYRQVFVQADDSKATDMIHLSPEEQEFAQDYDVRSLVLGLKKHPEVDVNGGIFTRCVQYCVENDAPYTLKNVWELASDIQAGRTPTHPPSPAGSSLLGRSQRRKRARLAALDAAERADYVARGIMTEDGDLIVDGQVVYDQQSDGSSRLSTPPRSATPVSVVDSDEDA